MGNITQETRNGEKVEDKYDRLGQLTRVNDPTDKTAGQGGTTWGYTYDLGGNMREKKRYAYTTNSLKELTPQRTVIYSYDDNAWKDKLTAFDGKGITYDVIGNPLSYDGWTYEWQAGRKLEGMYRKGLTLNPEDVVLVRSESDPETGELIPGTEVQLEDGRVGVVTEEDRMHTVTMDILLYCGGALKMGGALRMNGWTEPRGVIEIFTTAKTRPCLRTP